MTLARQRVRPLPLLVITAAGVYLTVPDTERTSTVLAMVVLATIVCFAAGVEHDGWVAAAVGLIIIWAAILDSGNRSAAVARAVGCFGVLLAAPVARLLNASSARRSRRPSAIIVVGVHCVLVGWSSRVLVREESLDRVVPAIAVALLLAVLVLVVAARPVTDAP